MRTAGSLPADTFGFMSADAPVTDHRTAGVMAVSVTTVAWGLVPLVLKQTHMPTLAFASYRLMMGALVYAVVFAATGRRLSWRVLKTCALGGVVFGADVALSFGAYKLTSVANATIIGALAPVFITLGAARWFGERVERRDLFFIGLSFVGVAAVAVGSEGSPSWSPLGDSLAMIGIFSWTAYWLFSKRARRTVSALEYMACVMLVAAIELTAVGFATGTSMAPPRGSDWAWIWVITIFPGALGHLMLAWSHRHVEAWLGALITQCQPVVGSVAAWALLGESLTVLTMAGGLVVLGATATILLRGARRGPGAITGSDEPLVPPGSG
jgi:drug/metabolite transporter (DMT)-like permease